MKFYKFFIVVIILYIITLPLTVVAKSEVDYLSIQSAQEGSLIRNSKNGLYTLTLIKVDPWVIYFSNAPKLITGLRPLPEFMDSLKDNKYIRVKNKGLNADLTAIEEPLHTKMSYTFTLLNFNYDAAKKVISYKVRLLPGIQRSFPPTLLHMKHITLFIDACASCGGSGF